jgi:hypothetical protein
VDAGVVEDSGTEVGMLGEEELPNPPASSKWTYSTMKSCMLESSRRPPPYPTPILALR